jgi:glycyl-tRNA synthetase beta subunit
MVWDGLGFFGTSTHKLDRLRGKKVTFFTKMGTKQAQFMMVLYLVAIIMVLIFEVGKFGTVSSVKIDLESKTMYEYNANQGLMICYGHWIFIEPLVQKARIFQINN